MSIKPRTKLLLTDVFYLPKLLFHLYLTGLVITMVVIMMTIMMMIMMIMMMMMMMIIIMSFVSPRQYLKH